MKTNGVKRFMSKNKSFKWIVGLSSVVLFTGFVGLTEKYDQTAGTSASNITNANQGTDSSGSYFSNDSGNDPYQGNFSDSGQDQGQYSGGSGQNSQDNQVNGHSS
jgi:hypothetical protein